MNKILIVDDERTARKGLYFILRSISKSITEASSVDQANKLLKKEEFDLAIVDLRLPDEQHGLRLIRTIRQMYPLTPILVMTAYGTVDSAVKAMQAGADDYVTKDFSKEEIILKVNRFFETRRLTMANLRLTEQVRTLEQQVDTLDQPNQIIGNSIAIKQILDLVARVGQDNDATVLITGESGTGKELVARSIHVNSPRRSDHKFIVVDVANMPATLLESQLFGHEKGAFTNAHQKHIGMFELADKGTVFLDEIGDFPLELQTKLLRFLQEKTFSRVGGNTTLTADVRIIAATNKNLETMVAESTFRQDLFYRLNVIPIHLPPLRDRREDIPALIRFYQSRLETQKGKTLTFPDDVVQKMIGYDWPGNIRQLKNLLERLYVICPNQTVTTNELNFDDGSVSDISFISLFKLPFKQARRQLLERFEAEFLAYYLHFYQGNISHIAKVVGESREGLSKKIKRYGLKND
ncbi:sigma-54-dependent Fis family transcriptional regulator [candidate division KSB1 bacterium]|nr:sigma-54-dependent Fis family transcriptional regulator [candidate division KSB1 bacterium]